MSDIKHLVSNHISPHSVLADAVEQINDIEQIYVIYKIRDGAWFESTCGDVSGQSFAIMILQKSALEKL